MNNQYLKRTYSYLVNIENVSDVLLTILGLAITCITGFSISLPKWLNISLVAVLVVMAIVKMCCVFMRYLRKKSYEVMQLEADLSARMLQLSETSSQRIIRILSEHAYSSRAKFHPFKYTENVMLYDVHSHIRSLLRNMQELLISYLDTTQEHVTVDLVYSYVWEKNSEWHIIKGGFIDDKENADIAEFKKRLSEFTKDSSIEPKTFYEYLLSDETPGFIFEMDKGDCFDPASNKERTDNQTIYKITNKDKINSNGNKTMGSVVGVVIDIKNDCDYPMVRAILTMNTYGIKIGSPKVADEDFKVIFKQVVVNRFKIELEKELMKMFIRHIIRDTKALDPGSGALSEEPWVLKN